MKTRQKPLLMQVFVARSPDGLSGKLETVRADDIESSEKKHDDLTSQQAKDADESFDRIGHYFCKNRAQWRDGFLYDLHPDHELKIWAHIANTVDDLWVAEPRELSPLRRRQLAMLVVAISNRIVDIPAHLNYTNDAMVAVAKYVFSGNALVNSQVPVGLPKEDGESALLDRITRDPDILFGKPCIRGLRYSVDFVLELLDSGMTDEQILADYEDLQPEDLRAAERYASLQKQDRRVKMQMAVA